MTVNNTSMPDAYGSGCSYSLYATAMTGDRTYGQITIRNAIASTSEIYTPLFDTSAEDDFEALDEEEVEEHAGFRPDLSRITLTLDEMQPHTNPRYLA